MRSKPALQLVMSAALGSAASVLLLPAEACWAYILEEGSCGVGVERAVVVASVGAREGWREGAPE